MLDQGAYPTPVIPSTLFTNVMRVMFPGAYRIRDLEFDATIVFSNKATYSAYRGPWEAETWARERLLDCIAHELDLDPVDVRRRNLLRDDEMPCAMVTGPTLSGITVRSALDKAERVAGYADFRAEQARARTEGRYLGLGVAAFIEAAPGPPDYGPAIGFAVPPSGRRRASRPTARSRCTRPRRRTARVTRRRSPRSPPTRSACPCRPCGWCTATAAPARSR